MVVLISVNVFVSRSRFVLYVAEPVQVDAPCQKYLVHASLHIWKGAQQMQQMLQQPQLMLKQPQPQ